jgi:GNAT superfamily N-acetyltransferase
MLAGREASEIDGLRRALSSAEINRIAPHVTLVPPVNVAEQDVPPACDLLRSVAADCGPLELDLGPPSSFLPVNPVCYLTVSGETDMLVALASLASRLGTGPLAPPPARPGRAFVAHVTINQHMAPERIAAAVEVLHGYRAHVVFEGVTLLEYSDAERRWRVLCDAPFRGPVLRGRGGVEIELSFSRHPDPGVLDWSRRTWEQYSVAQYGPDVHPDEPFTIAARVNGELAGVVEGEVRGLTCRLARLMVSPEWRSAGVGTQLLRAAEEHAIESGCARIRLETLAGSRAEGFYRGRGYEIVSNLSRWRGERDFVVMEAPLAQRHNLE